MPTLKESAAAALARPRSGRARRYEARAAGVKAGMWLRDAFKTCPNLVTAPYRRRAELEEARAADFRSVGWPRPSFLRRRSEPERTARRYDFDAFSAAAVAARDGRA